jgi:hypothetical protein
MADTFATVWRAVRLSVPDAPAMLCRQWVQDAWNDLAHRYGWGFLTYAGQIVFQASRTLTVTVTQGSTVVTSAGLFLATDQGRTFSAGTYPLYQIDRFVSVNEIRLALPFYGTGAGVVTNGLIQDAYTTMPTDFARFVAIVDPVNQRLVPFWATQEELDLLDPTRTSAESVPRMLGAAQASQLTQSIGQMQFELWPKPSAAGALQYYAVKGPAPLADSDLFPGVMRNRTDALREGALAKAARWPGTTDRKNPYFNLGLAKQHQDLFDAKILRLDIRDDDQFQNSWNTIPWNRWSAWAWAYDTRLLQATDATIGDYWGGGSSWGGLW